jgi:histidine triad (HIT) family protein
MPDCLFCKIVSGEIPADIVYQDDDVVAFKDIKPVAPHHVLVIPRKHVETVHDLSETGVAGKLLLGAAAAARELGVIESGYRLVINNGRDAHQEVKHVHVHLIAGRDMTWPPG